MRQFRPPILIIVLVAGCGIGAAAAQTTSKQAPRSAQPEAPGPLHEVYGTVKSIGAAGSRFTLQTRDGRSVQVDAAAAVETHRSNLPPAGHGVNVRGTYDAKGVLHAETVNRAKESPAAWPADR